MTFFKKWGLEKILNYTCGLHYSYGQCCPRGRRWCSSGERQSSGLSNCSINRHALRLSVWALFFLICRKPSAADAWAYGSSLMQIEWFLVLLTIRLKSSFLGFACWLPTSCLLSGFQKFIAIDSLSSLYVKKNYILVFQWDFRQEQRQRSTILNWKSPTFWFPLLIHPMVLFVILF